MSSTAAEKLVKELARKPSNTVCANCGTHKKFGFSTVCIKYYTFVCNNCKSSHQAISHRCKSLTMSSWTDKEVADLKRKGNDYARRTWLKNAPPVGQGGRPKEGDSVDVFKRFVVEAYERKKYYGEDEGAAPAHSNPAPAAAPRISARATTRAPVRKAVLPPAAPPVAPVADLLDFTSTTSVSTNNKFGTDFDAFAPSTPSVLGPSAGATSATAPIQNDYFQPYATQAIPISHGSSFNFINKSNSTTPITVPPASKVPAIKKPVMNNHGTTQASVVSNSPSSSSGFTANFDAFASSSSVPGSVPSTSAAAIQNDFVQPNKARITTTSNSSSFNFINNNSTTPTLAPAVPAIKKLVMNNSSMSQTSSLISSMNMPACTSNTQQQGLHNNIAMGGMGWNNNNNMANNDNPNAFGGMGNMNQTMMQQQQMNMMNGMMNGMHLNNNRMGMGMMGKNNMMMGNNNPMMMMMGNNNNQMMMNQQHATSMMNGNGFGGMTGNQKGNKSNGAMQSLQMNSSSMNAWSSGLNR